MTSARGPSEPAGPRPLVGLFAGIAAGLVASAAIAALEPRTRGSSDAEDSESADRTVRYVVGAVIGGIYGLLTEYRPEASAGFGGAYGVATSALLDDAAFDLKADPPVEPSPLARASPLIFGVVLEGIRLLVAGRRN